MSKDSSKRNKSKSDCECECVETIAEQLKRNIGDRVQVYERNADVIIIGTIKEVKDDSVLVLDQFPLKFICFCDQTSFSTFTELFISICEITQFGVITEAQESAFIESLNCNCSSNINKVSNVVNNEVRDLERKGPVQIGNIKYYK
jgi:hypothetical protein